eukprot:TRINITY_DN1599_c0_g1_i10.p1 TRINITY_DN1599_c0_g1~~TRINITY_DN1599_c0_g1_i10.p1  ORF type:complete len:406 (-),score=65.99 TRINITY_DN1599_c0_g1_i10:310-1527(-)
MCIRDRYQRRVRGRMRGVMVLVAAMAAWVAWDSSTGYLHLSITNNVALKHGIGSTALQRALEFRPPAADPTQHAPPELGSAADLMNASHGGTKPAVLRGALAGSAALASWSPSYLAEIFAEPSLQVERRVDPSQRPGSFADRIRQYEAGELSQVNQVFYYGLHAPQITRLLGELGEERVRAIFRESGYATLPGDGMGLMAVTLNVYRTGEQGQASGVSWHSHLVESPTTIQIRGTKRWRLVPPEFSPQMRPDPSWQGAVLFSAVSKYSYSGNTSAVDAQIPMLGTIPILDLTVSPGDMLFTPAGWWHSTLNPPQDGHDNTVISVVFSHASLGSTLWRTYPTLVPVSWLCLVMLLGGEVVGAATGSWVSQLCTAVVCGLGGVRVLKAILLRRVATAQVSMGSHSKA